MADSIPSFDIVAFSFMLRALQALIEASPTLLVGVIVAGALRGMIAPETIRRLFGEGSSGQLLRCSLLATLAPVCSLGVLPVMGELRRAGVPTSAVFSFGLAAPMLNPVTLVYGLTVLPPSIFCLLVMATVLVSWGVGMVTAHWSFEDVDEPSEQSPRPTTGWGRLAAAGIAVSQLLTGSVARDLAIGLTGAGLMAALLPPFVVPQAMSRANVWAAPIITGVSLPAFIAPAQGVVQVNALNISGDSLAAAVALHVFGVGANVALAVLLLGLFGVRRCLALLLVVFSLTMGLGFAADAAIALPSESEETHALDGLSRPVVSSHRMTPAILRSELAKSMDFATTTALALLAAGVTVGIAIRIAGSEKLLARLIESETPAIQAPQPAGLWNRPISSRVLASIAMVHLAALLVLLAYIYYPPPSDILEDMRIVRADALTAVRSGRTERALVSIESWDYLTAKLPMAAALRLSTVTPQTRQTTHDLRQLLDHLKSALRSGESIDTQAYSRDLLAAYGRCRQAYLHE